MIEETKADDESFPEFAPEWADVFGEDDFGIFAECALGGVRFVWRWICPGRFMMGCDETDAHGFEWEKSPHWVVITQGFWMGETPVTQAQWQAVMGVNPSHFKGDELPVEMVSWHQCSEFASKLNQLFPELHARLPTEAQWEYACRAEKQTAFNDGSACTLPDGLDPALDKLGWFAANSDGKTHPVRQKAPNHFGLYDMHGNVWEWCADDWGMPYSERKSRKVVEDPFADSSKVSANRVMRGGSCGNVARHCRSACRNGNLPGFHWRYLGLRLAAGQNEPRAAEPQGAERPAGAGEAVAVPGGP